MARGLTLDAGALIAAEKGSRIFWAVFVRALKLGAKVTVPAAVLAQAWRGNSPMIARVLAGCTVDTLDSAQAKKTGELLGKARRRDVVDASVVMSAVGRDDDILTSDPDDIGHLLQAAGAKLRIVPV